MEQEVDVPTDVEEEQGEVREVRIPRSPDDPTRAQVEEHRARAHLPYRSWCGHCVDWRKKNPPHIRTTGSAERDVPQVCLDYSFLRDRDESDTITCLVCKAPMSAPERGPWSTVSLRRSPTYGALATRG